MKTRRTASAAIGVVSVMMTAVAAIAQIGHVSPGQATGASAQAAKETSYVLLGDSIFAQGCMGSQGRYGCMCPILAASEFAGSLSMTPVPRVPLGHRGYDVTIEDWLFTFRGEVHDVTGTGYYDRWTDLQGNRWHAMTLDLTICGNEVQLLSGVCEDPAPGYTLPPELSIALQSYTECFGYMILLDAERQRADSAIMGPPGWFGGPCDYVETPGVATIVAVETPEPGYLSCPNDPVEVLFDYEPDDLGVPGWQCRERA